MCQAILLDNVVTEGEVRGLRDWCIAHNHSVQPIPIIAGIQVRLDEVLADDKVDTEEALEIAALLRQVAGDPIGTGELLTSANFPLSDPPPPVHWEQSTFLWTGTAAIGSRTICNKLVEIAGGVVGRGVNRRLKYLVIGRYVTPSWRSERFGNKILAAMERPTIQIISEAHFVKSYPKDIDDAVLKLHS